MWLNSVRSSRDDKPLSPVELLVLATAEDQFLNASELVGKLNNSTLMWQGAAGTLYPILHRLNKRGLLVKTGGRGTDFSRSKYGSGLLNRSLNPIKSQMKETNNYYVTIIDLLLSLQSAPMGFHEFLNEIESETQGFLEQIKILKEKAKDIKDDSVDVVVEFD